MRDRSRPLLSMIVGVVLLGTLLAHSTDGSPVGTMAGLSAKPAIVDWQSVESTDCQTYVQNLAAMGWPERTIRAVVTSDVIAAFADKRNEALEARFQGFQYWESNPSVTKADREFAAQRQAINVEMNQALQLLLGADSQLPDYSRLWKKGELDYELAFLNSAKREAAVVTLLKYEPVNEQMKELAGGLYLTEDTNQLQQILRRYGQEQATLQQILSPTECQKVEMTASWTAVNLRHAMVHFDPTETEFRAIFDAWQPHDEKLSRIYANRQADPGSASVYSKIKQQLSPARYKQYCATWWK